jgi:hypothetical protein
MKRPEDVTLSREEGEALLARLAANTLTAEDRQVLGKVLTFYFWLLFALREAKLSLKRLKALVFGEKPKPPKPPSLGGTPGGRECWRKRTAAQRLTRRALCRCRVTARAEATAAWAWAAGRRGVSRRPASGVSA